MIAEDIFIALTEIDDVYIMTTLESAIKDRKRKQTGVKIFWSTIAACITFIFVISAFYGVQYNNIDSPQIVYPDQNTSYTAYVESESIGHIEYYTYKEMAQRADLIICADVIDNACTASTSGTIKDHYTIYAKLNVNNVLKGSADKQSVVYVNDHAIGYYGTDGECASYGSVGPLLEKGNRVVLFLKEYKKPIVTEDGVEITHYISLGAEGKFFYDRDGKYHCTALYADKDYISQSMMADYIPKTLNEILELVQGE